MRNSRKIATIGIAISTIFVMTYFLRLPTAIGYINLGDSMILVYSYILGPISIIPAMIGSVLSDIASGYVAYSIPTAVIKALMAFASSSCLSVLGRSKEPTGVTKIIAFVLSEAIMVLGYFIYESLPFVYGIRAASFAALTNLVQSLISVLVACIVTESKRIKYREY